MGVKNIYEKKPEMQSLFFSCSAVLFILPDGNSVRSVYRKKKLKKRGRDGNIHERERRREKKKSYGRALAVHCGVLRPPTTLSLSLFRHMRA